MRKSHLILAILISFYSICNAIEINNISGELEKNLKDNTDITSLTISGTIDVRDFKFINENLVNLSYLDITKANITAFSGNIAYFGQCNNYAQNSIPQLAMFGKKYQSIKLPSTITTIGDGAFSGCINLTEIIIPQTVTSIGEYAFYDCDLIKAITLPENVTKIGNYAFAKCNNLESVNINSAISISDYAFANCEKLKAITFHDNTEKIGKAAFLGSASLNQVRFPSSLKTIDEDAFKGSRIVDIDLSEAITLTTIGKWAFADNIALNAVKLPQSIESIGDGAFFYNSNLQSISLPDKVNTISDFLLTGCSSIDPKDFIKSNISKIGKYAFTDWSQLVKFVIPASVDYIGDNAFENCSNIIGIYADPTEAPELGNDVFKGIDQPNTKLFVPIESEFSYRYAMQWNEFDIIPIQSGINEAISNNAIKVFFQDKTLNINANTNIVTLRLFDINGIQLVQTAPNSDSAQINTDTYFGNNYILTVELNNGKSQNFKLARK